MQRWHDVIDVNLTGAWNAVRAGLPTMLEAGLGGSIILISSTAGFRGNMGDWQPAIRMSAQSMRWSG